MMEYYEHKLDPVGTRPEWLADDDLMEPYNSNSVDFWSQVMEASADWSWAGSYTHIRIPASHWAVPALKAGKVPVRGGENAPSPEFMQSVKALAKCAMIQWSSGVYYDHAKAILEELEPDPIKAALQDKWPALDTDALRETLAKHNLKIVEA